MDTVAIFKKISLLGHFLRVILSLIFGSYIKFRKVRLINDPENISLDTKSIFLAGLEIKIS